MIQTSVNSTKISTVTTKIRRADLL